MYSKLQCSRLMSCRGAASCSRTSCAGGAGCPRHHSRSQGTVRVCIRAWPIMVLGVGIVSTAAISHPALLDLAKPRALGHLSTCAVWSSCIWGACLRRKQEREYSTESSPRCGFGEALVMGQPPQSVSNCEHFSSDTQRPFSELAPAPLVTV